MLPHSHHEHFKALGAIDWERVASSNLEPFLSETFAHAATIIDSVPVPEGAPAPAISVSSPTSPGFFPIAADGRLGNGGRTRSHTDSALRGVSLEAIRRAASLSQRQRQTGESMAHAQALRKEWGLVKAAAAGSKDNPLGISVYKLSGKDGKGNWFARRSIHTDLPFEPWKLGLEREFAETMKVQTGPGGGNIRGIGAEKRVEHHVVGNLGVAEVFQLSAQFPGPTAPRDFITLLMTSDCTQDESAVGNRLREYIIVSKPCKHPECPQRQGFIRGQYESVEIIREVPMATPEVKRIRSSVDLTNDGVDNLTREAVPRATRRRNSGGDDADTRSETAVGMEKVPVAVEWIMVTRSDPGGSVPRFMIDRGTPGAIVADAGKFVKWLTSQTTNESRKRPAAQESPPVARGPPAAQAALASQNHQAELPLAFGATGATGAEDDARSSTSSSSLSEHPPSSTGLYGIIASAIGAAGSVASKLPNPFSTITYSGSFGSSSKDDGAEDNGNDDDGDTISGASSSTPSFASALETSQTERVATPSVGSARSDSSCTIHKHKAASFNSTSNGSGDGLLDPVAVSGSSTGTTGKAQEKELRKIEERRDKLQDKIRKMQDRIAKRQGDREEDRKKDAAELAKLREKHDRDMAKQEERYRRETDRLEKKREAEERKAEAKRRKAAEREERHNLATEVEKLTAERDLARREAELLRAQVGNLQRENTMLVAKLGRIGALPRPSPVPARASVAGLPSNSSSEVDIAVGGAQVVRQLHG